MNRKGRMVVFDIDGTLANNAHRVHHLYPKDPDTKKDWDSFFAAQEYDTTRQDVVDVYDMYSYNERITMALLTGRGEEWREVTEQWLIGCSIDYDHLVMRPEGDRTNDDVLKLDQIKMWQAEGYKIIGFYDDRKRVCDAVRAHGITVFQMSGEDF